MLCNLTLQEGAPRWLAGSGQGWLTAEYALLPRSTHTRTPRENGLTGGRTQEIRRFIGRSLRAGLDLARLGERTLILDCDVLQADGGTRTAAVTGGYVALALALRRLAAQGVVPPDLIRTPIAAVSVGVVHGEVRLDLCYEEDQPGRSGPECGDDRGRAVRGSSGHCGEIPLLPLPAEPDAGPGPGGDRGADRGPGGGAPVRGFTPRQRFILALMATAVIVAFGLLGYVVVTTTRQMAAPSPLPSLESTVPPGSPTAIPEPSPTEAAPSPTAVPTPTRAVPLSQIQSARAVHEVARILARCRDLPPVEQFPVSFPSEREIALYLLQRYGDLRPQEALAIYGWLGLALRLGSPPLPDVTAQAARTFSLYAPAGRQILLVAGQGPPPPTTNWPWSTPWPTRCRTTRSGWARTQSRCASRWPPHAGPRRTPRWPCGRSWRETPFSPPPATPGWPPTRRKWTGWRAWRRAPRSRPTRP